MCMCRHVLAICRHACSQVLGMIDVGDVVAVVMPGHPVLAGKPPIAYDAMVRLWSLGSSYACRSLRTSRSLYRWKRPLKCLAGRSKKCISSSAFLSITRSRERTMSHLLGNEPRYWSSGRHNASLGGRVKYEAKGYMSCYQRTGMLSSGLRAYVW